MNVMTAADLAALIPEKWDKKIFSDAVSQAYWDSKNLVGPEGAMKAIVEKEDFTKEPGDTLRLMVMSELRGAGTTGETLLQGREEKLSVGQFSVKVDWLKHAVGITEKASKAALIDAILVAGNKLAPWLATKLSDDVFKELLVTALDKMTVLYADEVADRDTLVLGSAGAFSAHSLDLDDISMVKLALVRKGTLPLMVTRKSGAREPWYGLIISEIDGYRLASTDAWKQAQRDANVRGEDNPIFSGALGVYGGMILYPYSGIADSRRKGTPLRPEAVLVTATTAGAVTQTIYVGSATDDGIDYTRNFPTPPSGASVNVWTGNPVDGTAAEIDKVRISYSSKTNNTLECTTAPAAGYLSASVGTVVTLENVSRNLGFGAEVVARGWGLKPTKATNSESYGDHLGVGIKCVYGVKAIEDTDAKIPNAVILETYAHNPGRV